MVCSGFLFVNVFVFGYINQKLMFMVIPQLTEPCIPQVTETHTSSYWNTYLKLLKSIPQVTEMHTSSYWKKLSLNTVYTELYHWLITHLFTTQQEGGVLTEYLIDTFQVLVGC